MSVHTSGRKVTIVGGGVAGLEALLALRSLAAGLTELELIADRPQFTYRPMAVAEPFHIGTARTFALTAIAREARTRLHVAGVAAVDTEARRLQTWDGRSFGYDLLLVAPGARTVTAIPGSISVRGPGYTGRFRTVLHQLEQRRITRVTFAVPSAASWPLPLYELALLTARHVAAAGLRKVELRLVTHESEPLELFGADASAEVRALLEERSVQVVTDRVPIEVHDGRLITAPGPPLPADRVVSLPGLAGPALAGLPHDEDGFIPVDLYGRVRGLAHVFAAGDATTCPIKQGGVATQQADATAETIAAELGADVVPKPFRPVLRGLLLTGDAPLYLRAEVSGGRGAPSPASEDPLWWPPAKIAGRHLAPYLAGHAG